MSKSSLLHEVTITPPPCTRPSQVQEGLILWEEEAWVGGDILVELEVEEEGMDAPLTAMTTAEEEEEGMVDTDLLLVLMIAVMMEVMQVAPPHETTDVPLPSRLLLPVC